MWGSSSSGAVVGVVGAVVGVVGLVGVVGVVGGGKEWSLRRGLARANLCTMIGE